MNLLTVIFRKISVLGVWALLFSVFLSGETVFGQTKESLQYGDLLYSQKQYVLAARQYSTYLQSNAKASGAESVWYKLGECYLKNKQYADSQTTFKYIVDTYKKGPIVGAAAYSLAVLNYNKKNAGDAERYFGIAARESKDPMEQVKAKYYLAKTLQLAQKFDPALKLYQEVIDTKIDGKDNPLKDRSQLELARAKFDKGDIKGALDLFESLSRTAVSEDVKQEALARAGLLAAQAGEVDRSEKLLEQVLKSSETNPWREYAQVGIIYNAFARQDYDKVVGIYSLGNYKVDEKSRAKVLLIIGHSYRMKGELPHAERLYKLIEAKFPDTPEGSEAGFRVLQVLHQQNKGSLPVAVRAFTEKLRQKDSNNKFIDLANLLLAEWYFSQAEKLTSIQDYTRAKDMYRGASTAYNSVRESNIDPKHHAPRLYKLGWSLLEIGNVRSGVQVVSQFISKNPDSPLTSSAIAKRAATYQNLQDHDFALKDYQSIIKDYPKAPEVELAMQQVALIYGHKKDIPKMIEAYKALLAKFPNTSGSDEAYYWIGVGLFDQKKYAESIDPLNKAREMAPTKYRDSAGIRIILSHYQLEKIDPLATEAKRYIQAGKGILGGDKDKARPQLSPIVLQYLGQKLMDKKDYGQAEYFLNELSTPEAPEKTPIEVWKALADCRQELKMHEGVIAAYDHYLLQTERPSERALAYKNRGISQLALKRFSPAKESARECLKNQKEGRINAEGRLLLGDVYAAEGDLDSAVREYLIVSQVFDDREITPQAFSKAIKAYESLGKSTEVKDLQEQLRSRFPDYRE